MQRRRINISEYADEIMRALPGGILLTTAADDIYNSMVIGWGGLGVCWGRRVFTVYVRTGRYTRELLDRNPEFTINVPVGGCDPKILEICGTKSGRDIDKIHEAGLTLIEGENVSAPALAELPLTLECQVLYSQEQDLSLLPEDIAGRFYPQDVGSDGPGANRDAHIAYIGEIVDAYILE